MHAIKECVVWLNKIGIRDASGVGEKNASLGELLHTLAPEGISIPDGFALTTVAYRNFVEANALEVKLTALLAERASGTKTWQQVGGAIRNQILDGEFPQETARQVKGYYQALGIRAGSDNPAVAVRSSAVAGDGPDASITGQRESQLNVQGETALLDACKRCYASLFTDSCISHKDLMRFGRLTVALSVGIQLMVRSDIGAAGVMSSMETERGFPGAAVIRANWGFGGSVVQGIVAPDKYAVFNPIRSNNNGSPVIEKSKGSKVCKLVSAPGGVGTEMVDTTLCERNAFVLNDEEIVRLGHWALEIDRHFGRPMDIEWAKDGDTEELFVVQAGTVTGKVQTF